MGRNTKWSSPFFGHLKSPLHCLVLVQVIIISSSLRLFSVSYQTSPFCRCCGESPCPRTNTCPESFNTSCGSGCLTNGQTICCSGQVTPFQMGPNRRRCCGRVTYNGSTQRCLNAQVVGVKMCPAQRCGGMLKGGIGCRSTNDSVLGI